VNIYTEDGEQLQMGDLREAELRNDEQEAI
jgi:hypothetical protein